MKAADPTWKRRLALALAIIAGAALTGYGTGRAGRQIPTESALRWSSSAGATEVDDFGIAGSAHPPPPSGPEREKRLRQIKKRLRGLWENPPHVAADWEAEREGRALLQQLSAEELGDFLKEVQSEAGAMAHYQLRGAILSEWVLRDGPAAMEASMISINDFLSPVRALDVWAAKDPEAALAWLRSDTMSPELADKRSGMRVNILRKLAEKDFGRAVVELEFMDSDEKKSMLQNLGSVTGGDPAKSAQVNELIAQHDPSIALSLEKSAVSRMAAEDPAAALDHIASLDLSDNEKTELEIAQVKGAAAKGMTESYNAWVSRHEDGAPIPKGMLTLIDGSFVFNNAETIQWLDSLPTGATRDAIYEHGTRLLAARGDFSKAAAYADTIGTPATRAAALRRLRTMWAEADSEAAKTWQETLRAEDRSSFD